MTHPFVAECLEEMPLIAILRGLPCDDALSIVTTLHDAGFKVAEVPLNTPDAFRCIEMLAEHFLGRMAIGAGTVLTVDEVQRVHRAGGQLVVSPNLDVSVVRMTGECGMHSLPGVVTSSECMQAIEAGADGLKLFPSSSVGLSGLKEIRDALPLDTQLYAVGGVDIGNFEKWLTAGVNGIGFGSWLYKPGDPSETVAARARILIDSYSQRGH